MGASLISVKVLDDDPEEVWDAYERLFEDQTLYGNPLSYSYPTDGGECFGFDAFSIETQTAFGARAATMGLEVLIGEEYPEA